MIVLQEATERPGIPTLGELESAEISHDLSDHYSPPAITNFHSAIQANFDLTAVKSFTSPPLSSGESSSPHLYLNGRYFNSYGPEISFKWRPDRIVRKAHHREIACRSVTALIDGRPAGLIVVELENTSNRAKELTLSFRIDSAVTSKSGAWDVAEPPQEDDNERSVNEEGGYVTFRSRKSQAVALQGVTPSPDWLTGKKIGYKFSLPGGKKRKIYFFYLLGSNERELEGLFGRYSGEPERYLEEAKESWNKEIASIFTPGSGDYSGYLPILRTTNEDLKRIYYFTILGTVYHKRFFDDRKTYVTLMPRYWQTTTFLWDISLSSVLFANLDPNFLKNYIEDCLRIDVHNHHSIENMTGSGAGPWYSVNDFALIKMAYNYLRYNGDLAWLEKRINGRAILDHLKDLATHWKDLDVNGHGLADYGGVDNLLECVYSYVHEVPSLNAANVFNLKVLSLLFEKVGRKKVANDLRKQAQSIAEQVNQLYVKGGGYWRSRLPDGSTTEVNHCYDFLTILETFSDHLDSSQQDEMIENFVEELMTPTWMRALSPADDDATTSVRPDHQWLGAYTAWPAISVLGMFKNGYTELASKWLEGLAQTAKQGPFGQAHVVEEAMESDAGGAKKSPSDFPYICDWACVSNGSYFQAILEGPFGLAVGLEDGISAEPRLDYLDRDAELYGLRFNEGLWRLTGSGLDEI